ncbi:MAG: NfeD family protein [Candidatus Thorarchaeota archaeon]
MDAWVKLCVVLLMLSMLSWVVGYVMFDPFTGLIILAVILTLLVMTLEPATGKAMAQVVIPLIVILFVFQVYLNGQEFNVWMLFATAAILFLMLAMFTGGSGLMHGGFIDAKLSLKLFPIYGLAIVISALVDPTHRTTVYIMAGTVLGLMILYAAFLRNYDEWPEYQYHATRDLIALTDINPKGKVKAGAEIWWARTIGPPIRKGERVRLIALSGITMIVAREEEGASAAAETSQQNE